MANTVTDLVPVLLANALITLRETVVMTRLVNRDYSNMPANQGDTVNVWLGAPETVSDITPQAVQPTPTDSVPKKVPVQLTKWRHAGFYLNDKEQDDIVQGLPQKQTAEVIRALAADVNAFIFSKYKKVYGIVGTPGTTPFATDTTGATQARKVLNQQLAPMSPRRIVLDPTSEANAVELAKLTTVQNVGNQQGIIAGQLGTKLGYDWFMDQQVPTHTNTPLTAGAATVNGAQAVGVGSTDNGRTGTVSIAKATNASPLVAGDILTFAGDAQNYVVLADISLIVGNTTVAISPALKVAKAGGEAVTVKATHVVNLAFHPDAFAFASRPLQTARSNVMERMSIPDPQSGLVLRLEVIRQYKQDYFDFDILYGAECVRPELAVRIAG